MQRYSDQLAVRLSSEQESTKAHIESATTWLKEGMCVAVWGESDKVWIGRVLRVLGDDTFIPQWFDREERLPNPLARLQAREYLRVFKLLGRSETIPIHVNSVESVVHMIRLNALLPGEDNTLFLVNPADFSPSLLSLSFPDISLVLHNK